jgi:hypothetical protein
MCSPTSTGSDNYATPVTSTRPQKPIRAGLRMSPLTTTFTTQTVSFFFRRAGSLVVGPVLASLERGAPACVGGGMLGVCGECIARWCGLARGWAS